MKHLTHIAILLAAVCSFNAYAQNTRTITGTVRDSKGEPVPGAALVSVKDQTRGAIADIDGRYSLELSKNEKSFVVQSIGFSTQTVEIGTRSV